MKLVKSFYIIHYLQILDCSPGGSGPVSAPVQDIAGGKIVININDSGLSGGDIHDFRKLTGSVSNRKS